MKAGFFNPFVHICVTEKFDPDRSTYLEYGTLSLIFLVPYFLEKTSHHDFEVEEILFYIVVILEEIKYNSKLVNKRSVLYVVLSETNQLSSLNGKVLMTALISVSNEFC